MDQNQLPELVRLSLLAEEQSLRACNEITAKYGLSLSEAQIRALTERRFGALRDTGRVEFGGGIMKKLIVAFCDSPYLEPDSYEETLCDLQDSFYYYKNEFRDQIADDELIDLLKRVFDGRAQGSADYLAGLSPEELCRYAREPYDPEDEDSSGDLF